MIVRDYLGSLPLARANAKPTQMNRGMSDITSAMIGSNRSGSIIILPRSLSS